MAIRDRASTNGYGRVLAEVGVFESFNRTTARLVRPTSDARHATPRRASRGRHPLGGRIEDLTCPSHVRRDDLAVEEVARHDDRVVRRRRLDTVGSVMGLRFERTSQHVRGLAVEDGHEEGHDPETSPLVYI